MPVGYKVRIFPRFARCFQRVVCAHTYANFRSASATLLPFKRFQYTCVFTSPLSCDQSYRTKVSPKCQFYNPAGLMFLAGRVILSCSDVYRSFVELEDDFCFILRDIAFQMLFISLHPLVHLQQS